MQVRDPVLSLLFIVTSTLANGFFRFWALQYQIWLF